MLDHIDRLYDKCIEERMIIMLKQTPFFQERRKALIETLLEVIQLLVSIHYLEAYQKAKSFSDTFHSEMKETRHLVMSDMAKDTIEEGNEVLESLRWMRRVSKYITKITYHTHLSMVKTGE